MAVHRNPYGFRIEYPDAWSLQEERSEDRHVVTVGPDGTTFWSATVLFDRPSPRDVLHAVASAFQEEFPEIDLQQSKSKLGGLDAESTSFEFVCWDLTNSAMAQAARTADYTLLVLYQFTDSEQEDVEDLLRAVSQSLSFA